MTRILIVVAVCALLSSFAMASTLANQADQTINVTVDEVAMLAGNAAPAQAFVVSSPATAGGAPRVSNGSTNLDLSNELSNTWLQYTSILPSDGDLKTLTVELANATPAGLTMSVKAAAPAAGGDGDKGTNNAASYAAISSTGGAITLTKDIGSCYTGTTLNASGVNVSWQCAVTSVTDLKAHALTDLAATYTLTATGL
jgi:Tfp pilus assembly protein FimT